MADVETLCLLTSATVIGGQWAQKKTVTARMFIGGFVYLLAMGVFAGSNYALAEQFALLVFVGALLNYAIPLTKGLGLSNG